MCAWVCPKEECTNKKQMKKGDECPRCGAEVKDLQAGCCGLAGTFGMQKKNYELSSEIAARLKEALESLPEQIVLTECSACKMQIEHLSGAIVKHPIKIIADCY